MINLHESIGPGRDRTRNPWNCSQTRICSQTRYRLRREPTKPEWIWNATIAVWQWLTYRKCVDYVVSEHGEKVLKFKTKNSCIGYDNKKFWFHTKRGIHAGHKVIVGKEDWNVTISCHNVSKKDNITCVCTVTKSSKHTCVYTVTS